MSDYAELIPEKWRDELERFLRTGNASPEFLAYLDNDPDGQQAVETALQAESSGFEKLAETVRPVLFGTTSAVSAQITNALEDALNRPPNERKHAFRKLRDSETMKQLDEPARRRVREVVRDLSESLIKS